MLIDVLQWTGSIFGVLGAWAVGRQDARIRLYGFFAFTASNVVLIAAFILMPSFPLLAMQVAFLATSLDGLRTNRQAIARATDAG